MSSDFTEHQSDDQLQKARRLSVEPTQPPAKIEGYDIQNFIGRGSYGEVWSAVDQKTGKRVAIKFYAQRTSADVKQLAQEVEKLVVLAADRYVVQLLDVGWDASPPYYVMDFIEFGSLEDRIKTGEPLPVSRAVEVFKEVATGLMHLHGKGILHCDLKPGNVLLDQDGKPRLADFGQSRLSTDETAALGTLFYMAPEQADLRSVPDAKWDVYGLGALLYTMLKGKPPYYSEDLKTKIEDADSLHDRLKMYRQSLISSPAPKDHRGIDGVDRSLADIIDRCIAAKPANRLESAQSVLAALHQREFKRQNRPLMLLGILGPILLLLLMSLFGWFAFRQATNDANVAIVDQAIESNGYAAAFASRSAAEQLDEYFRVVRQVSKDDDFKIKLTKVLQDGELRLMRKRISNPSNNFDESLEETREKFRANSIRMELQPFLQKLLVDPENEYPEAASWFVTDRFGNQIAAVFDNGSTTTIGKNYSYRTYFSGEPEDLKDESGNYIVESNPEQRKIIQNPHLSASFPSQATGLQKVAFSAPILDDSETVIGLVAVTVNVGKLVDFENGVNQYVMLVDNRKNKVGIPAGIVLEHPLYFAARDENPSSRIPDELANVRINIEESIESGSDPFGDTSLGDAFCGKFVVAKAEVVKESKQIQNSASSEITGNSGLFVLAFERLDTVLEPSRKLGERLGRLAITALLILLSVAVGMWQLVKRVFRETRRQISNPSGTDSSVTFGNSGLPTNSATGSTTRGTGV